MQWWRAFDWYSVSGTFARPENFGLYKNAWQVTIYSNGMVFIYHLDFWATLQDFHIGKVFWGVSDIFMGALWFRITDNFQRQYTSR